MRDKILKELNKRQGKAPLPVRPFCVDSLGNVHYERDLWLRWTERSTTVSADPGQGFEQVDEMYSIEL